MFNLFKTRFPKTNQWNDEKKINQILVNSNKSTKAQNFAVN